MSQPTPLTFTLRKPGTRRINGKFGPADGREKGVILNNVSPRMQQSNQPSLSTSRSNPHLFQSRFRGVSGENVSRDKILWFKSVSPTRRNVVLRFTSPPRTITPALIRNENIRLKKYESLENVQWNYKTPRKTHCGNPNTDRTTNFESNSSRKLVYSNKYSFYDSPLKTPK